MRNNRPELPKDRFRDYALSFAPSPEQVPSAIQLKLEHTFDVCSITDIITEREQAFTAERAKYLASLAAFFHDVSRFRQYRDYHTFRDAESFDHGAVSAEIFEREFHVEGLTPQEIRLVSTAIRHHNKRTLPQDIRQDTLPYAQIVRDADKLSILKIVNAYFALPAEQQDPAVKSGTEDTPGFTEKLVHDAIGGIQIAHADMRNLNDFKISFFAWAQDLTFPASAEYVLRNGLYPKLRAFLPDAPILDELLAVTLTRLEAKAGKR